MPTDVSAPLPDVSPRELTVYTVTLDDPAAVILSMTLHGWQDIPVPVPDAPTPKLTLEPSAGGPGET